MLNVVGGMMLVAVTTSFGFQKAQKLQQRTDALRVFQDGLALLQTEVSYGQTPLPTAFKKRFLSFAFTSKGIFSKYFSAFESR